jgi:hypothetical protein
MRRLHLKEPDQYNIYRKCEKCGYKSDGRDDDTEAWVTEEGEWSRPKRYHDKCTTESTRTVPYFE